MAQGFLRNIISVSSTNAFNSFVKVFSGILIARYLGPEGKGVFASLLVVPAMILTLSELGVRRSAIQHIGEKKLPVEKVISVLAFFFMFTSLVGVIVTSLVYSSLDQSDLSITMILLALASIPIRLINKFNNGIIVGEERFKISNKLKRIPVILNFIFILVFILILKLSVTGALFALVLSSIISAIYGLNIISKKYKISIKFDFEIMKSLLSIGVVYAIALFLARLNFKIDILLLQKMASSSEVGFYSLGANIAESWQSPFAVGAVILASSANAKNQNEVNKNVAHLFRMTFLFTIIVSIAIFALAPFFVPIVYSKAFIPSIPIVQYILPAIVWLISSKLLASRIAGLKKTKYIIFVLLPCLLINVVLNIFLIPDYGAMGAVMATNVSYFISFIGVVFIYCRFTNSSIFMLFRFQKDDFKFGKLLKSKKKKS